MKVFLVACFLVLIYSFTFAKCPPGEYYPGPDCSMEPYCSPRQMFSLILQTRHHSCICWCSPGTFRNLLTKECTFQCPKGTEAVDENFSNNV